MDFKVGLVIFLIAVLSGIRGFPFPDNSLETDDDDFSFEPDEAVGRALQLSTDENVNPEELGTYAEGDIIIPFKELGRNGVTGKNFRWPDGIIPYVIKGKFTDEQLRKLNWAFNEYHTHTCLKFIERTDEDDYVSIENDITGCWSYGIGRIGGQQTVNFQTPHCMKKNGTIIHELMHAVGFLHEQNRPDREPFVEIVWDNIPKNYWNNFFLASPEKFSAFDVPYDYSSVMHYSKYAFSKNSRRTIRSRQDDEEVGSMGQRLGFSEKDILKINMMYHCSDDDY